MERLTKRNNQGIGVCAVNCDKKYPTSCMGCDKAYDAFNNLSAYEDTELEPSEIEGLKVDYRSVSKEFKRMQYEKIAYRDILKKIIRMEAENKAYRTIITEYEQNQSNGCDRCSKVREHENVCSPYELQVGMCGNRYCPKCGRKLGE